MNYNSNQHQNLHKKASQSLSIAFPVSTSHFIGNQIKLKCSASIANVYWKSSEIILKQDKPKSALVIRNGDTVKVKAKVKGGPNAVGVVMSDNKRRGITKAAATAIEGK